MGSHQEDVPLTLPGPRRRRSRTQREYEMRGGMAALAAFVLVLPAVVCPAHGGIMSGGPEEDESGARSVFYNGRVYTMDEDHPYAEALVVAGSRIVFVGTGEGALEAAGPGARRYDLGGMTVIPGLVDAHAHFVGYALGRAALDLTGTGSLDEMLGRLEEGVESFGKGAWITGRGWDQNDWERGRFPVREDLDSVSPDNPVLLTRVCGHAAVASSRALAAAGIGRGTPDPEGGRIERDDSGEPTGVLIDGAIALVREVIPPLPREEKKRLMISAARACLAAGLTGTHEMGIDSETVGIYRELYDAGELPLRITAYFDGDSGDLDSVLAAGPMRDFAGGMFYLAGVKFYCDGSLGARSAALLEDYSDDPGNRGLLVTDPGVLLEKALACQASGFQVATHAIGDRANRIVLDIYEKMLESDRGGGIHHRVEHAQVLSSRDIGRFASLGVVPSMQFTHCTSDMPWVEARLGSGRIEGAYAWRSLIEAGSWIPGGSDYPVESIDPLLGIYAAVTRQDPRGEPPGGWMPGQRLTIEEAVMAFTLYAARAAGREGELGSIEPGKFADLTILDSDLMKADPADIPRIKVVATVLDGKVEYRAEGSPF